MINGTLDMVIGSAVIGNPYNLFVSYTRFYFSFDYFWVVRKPVPLFSPSQLINIFSTTVWIWTILTLLVFSLAFGLTYKIYRLRPYCEFSLLGPLNSNADFLLLPIAAIIETDPLPWFPRHSAGKNSINPNHRK